MQLQHADYAFTLLTPCFSGTALGKLDDHAEMRIPPLRGHIRFWHRALFDAADCNRVWGSTSGNDGQGSRVSLRFVGSVSTTHANPKPTLLPHKPEPPPGKSDPRGPRPGLAAGENFTFRLQRLVGCTAADWDHAQRAIKLWLLLGCLGLRSNRAAGSVWPENWQGHPAVPQTIADLKSVLQDLGLRNWSVAIVGLGAGKSAADLRETASDTIKGNPYQDVFGGIGPRHPSPTKFKVASLAAKPGQSQQLCLLATAPARQIAVNGASQTILRHAEQLLLGKPQPARWKALGPWQPVLP
jgi:hypothetical protein